MAEGATLNLSFSTSHEIRVRRNPVVRGLVQKPEQWKWSSFRHHATGIQETVETESFWTAARRNGELPAGFTMKKLEG
jgi:putative transposase